MNRKRLIGWIAIVLCLCLRGMSGAGQTQRESQPASSASSPLYMLTYDHGGLILWGQEHFERHLRGAVEWLDRYPGFKIGLDNEAYTYDQLARQAPQVLQRIRQHLKGYTGRFAIGTCTYGQPLSMFINEESNIRQIGYALDADRRHFGCAPTVYLMSEHAMHSQMPQILNGFGFTGAIMRTHYMMYGYNPTFDAAIGWWVGLDGSRIPAIPTYKGQGAEFGRTTVDNWILTRYPGSNAQKSPSDFRREFSHIQPLLATRADDAGLKREELVREYEGKTGYEWMLLEEIFSTFPAPTEYLQTAPNDFVVRMPWGYCGNEIWNQCRAAEVAVLTAERLAAIERMVGGPDHHDRLQDSWKNLLIAQHHDVQICGLLSDARTFLQKSLAISEDVAKTSLQYLASQMSREHPQVVIFNPISWPSKSWLEVPVSLPRGYAKNLAVHWGDHVVPSAILSADLHSDGSLRDIDLAVCVDSPGLSVSSFQLLPGEHTSSPGDSGLIVDSENLKIESPHLEIQFHPKGGLSSITDKQTGRKLTQPAKKAAFFAGKVDGEEATSYGTWVLREGQGGAPWALACENGFVGSIPYRLEMKVYRDTPRIDCSVLFHFDGQKIGRLSTNTRDSVSGFVHEDKLRFKMFPAVDDKKATGVRDLPFAISETSDSYVNGLYWNAVTDGENGIAFFNRGTMGAVREKDGGFSMPLAYAMYYIWGTRMLRGDFVYEFAVHASTGAWQEADLHRRAIEYNFQPVGTFTGAGTGKYDHLIRPLILRPSDTVVSAFYNVEKDFYVRLYEHEGREQKVSVEYKLGDIDLSEVSLAGEELINMPGQFSLEPWKIKTLRLRLGRD